VSESSPSSNDFPEAEVREGSALAGALRSNASRLWIVTAVCLVIAVVLFVTANRTIGTMITVRFEQGHGIKPGDMLRHRGIEVGEVRAVKLNHELSGVVVEILLEPAAAGLAREGSRFWVARPRFSLARVSGLDTVVGAKYLGVLPGPANAAPRLAFEGDETPLTVLDSDVLEIAIRFRDGRGLQEGDELRHRGIVVGEVSRVELNDQLSGVNVTVRLVASARRLARVGSQFWIERPDVSLTGIRGLETLVGGRYIAVLPGPPDAKPLAKFDGLESAPAATERLEGGLEITLESVHRRGVKAGAPVLYRGQQVGSIVSVGLSPDASRVESRAYIDPPFKRLVRSNTVFWTSSGIQANFSISGGFELSAESLETIAAGGISLATPDAPGKPVNTGHRFVVYSKGDESFDEEAWTQWQPHIAVGSIVLPEGSTLPQPLRAALSWPEKRLGLTRHRQREGWLLALSDQRLLGPADLLIPPANAVGGAAQLQFAGQQLEVSADQLDLHGKLATLKLAKPLGKVNLWPAAKLREPTDIEEVFVVAGTAELSFPIPKNRLTAAAGVREWSVDPSFAINPSLNGACIVSPQDGAVIGMLVVDNGLASVAFVPVP